MGRAHASDFLPRAAAGGATAQAVSRQQERTIAPASLDEDIGISVSLKASKSFRAARGMRFARRRHRTCAFSVSSELILLNTRFKRSLGPFQTFATPKSRPMYPPKDSRMGVMLARKRALDRPSATPRPIRIT